MEIKATLEKPFTKQQKCEFVVNQNHQLGYEIKETEEELQAWGLSKEETEEQEKQDNAKLSLTKREIFLALYKDKNITPEDIKAKITETADLIEFEYASEYFRGNPLIEKIGKELGYNSEQLDYLFKNKTFKI